MAPKRIAFLCISLVLGNWLDIRAPAAEALDVPDSVTRVTALRYPRNVGHLRLLQEQVQRVAQQAMPATVGVLVGRGAGSGVIVSADGLVLTAGHVIGKANRRATILLPDGRELLGKTLGANHDVDAGMVQLDNPPDDLPFLPIAKTKPKIGEWVITTGQPGGMVDDRSPPLRLGRVLGIGEDWVCTDCTLVGGDSGGPLINLRGEVLGIHSSIGPAIVHNFHIPVVEFQSSWDRLLAGEVWGGADEQLADTFVRPLMGITGKTEAGQCLITEVFRGFPAFEADVRVGDAVVEFDGTAVSSFEEVSQKVLEKSPGQKIQLRIARNDKMLDVDLVLAGIRVRVPGKKSDAPKPSEEP